MPQTPSSWHTSIFIVSTAVVALLAGAYCGALFQKQSDDSVIANKDSMIMSMQQQITLQQASQVSTSTPAVAPQTPLITSSSLPENSDRLCRDGVVALSWKADPGRVDEVRISINAPFPASPIADVPVSYNEIGAVGEGSINWTIGDAAMGTLHMQIPDGDLYRIQVDALQNGAVVGTQYSGTFAIDTCRG